MTVLSVASQKGGCGKTTIATNLARSFQRNGHDVLIADQDAQKSATDWALTGESNDHQVPDVIQKQDPSLERQIRKIGSGYDAVIIDGAGQIQRMSVSAVRASDLVLIPIQPSALDAWSADELISIIKARQEATDGQPKAAIVMSRRIVGTNVASEVQEGLGMHDMPILNGTCQRVSYVHAIGSGCGVQDLDPSSKAAREIDHLTDDIYQILSD